MRNINRGMENEKGKKWMNMGIIVNHLLEDANMSPNVFIMQTG